MGLSKIILPISHTKNLISAYLFIMKKGENMKKIMTVVKQREVEYPEKLEFYSPFWYKLGIWKVDYSKKIKTDL